MKSAPNDTRKIFRKCGTCSQTFAHLINRANRNNDKEYELAMDPLAGGIFRQGQQCGMLWGAALAVGREAYNRSNDVAEAQVMAILATEELTRSFEDHTRTIQCREITGVRMNNLFGLLKFMVESMIAGFDNHRCFILAENWTPDAVKIGQEFAQETTKGEAPAYNCASEMARRLGATEREAVMVAGFAGGLGLRGKGCGALAVAIWMIALQWIRSHPGEHPPMFRYPAVSKLLSAFRKKTGGALACEKICGKKFHSPGQHAEFISQGGCNDILTAIKQNIDYKSGLN